MSHKRQIAFSIHYFSSEMQSELDQRRKAFDALVEQLRVYEDDSQIMATVPRMRNSSGEVRSSCSVGLV